MSYPGQWVPDRSKKRKEKEKYLFDIRYVYPTTFSRFALYAFVHIYAYMLAKEHLSRLGAKLCDDSRGVV